MSKGLRETVADWLLTAAAVLLLLSLFLTWSHQFSPSFLARYAGSALLQGIPRDPNAWQVYSGADLLLALLAGWFMVVALWGGTIKRLALTLSLVVALVFVIHAVSVPPTNGAVAFDPAVSTTSYVPNAPRSGPGEIVALLALVLGTGGVLLSYTVDP